ncbi:MAG: glutamate synthase, partial [Deltaproteobacteria bacterium]|nr:glutamate synthase [Deltaproteobacteria bacterium]
MERAEHIRRIIQSRAELVKGLLPLRMEKREEEGGCGVTGFACSVPVRGKHIFEPSRQMHNRGNGRGGGIAAMGFDHKMLGVSRDVLEQDYILQIALLEEGVMGELEKRFIEPVFEVHSSGPLPHVDDYRDIPGLEVRPPDVWRYFVRVKPHVLTEFVEKNQLQDLKERQAEDEFVYQNSFRINKAFYDAYGKQQAF